MNGRRAVVIAVLPGLVALGLFYSLAIHMYESLGAWPVSIGEVGFPLSLTIHATIATIYVGVIQALSIIAWPVALFFCLLDARRRFLIRYLVLFALVSLTCLGLMQLAPAPFLLWWLD